MKNRKPKNNSKIRKPKKELVKKLQNYCNQFGQMTGFMYKILIGLIVFAGAVSLVGCSQFEGSIYEDPDWSMYNKDLNNEKKFENLLCKFLCEKTRME